MDVGWEDVVSGVVSYHISQLKYCTHFLFAQPNQSSHSLTKLDFVTLREIFFSSTSLHLPQEVTLRAETPCHNIRCTSTARNVFLCDKGLITTRSYVNLKTSIVRCRSLISASSTNALSWPARSFRLGDVTRQLSRGNDFPNLNNLLVFWQHQTSCLNYALKLVSSLAHVSTHANILPHRNLLPKKWSSKKSKLIEELKQSYPAARHGVAWGRGLKCSSYSFLTSVLDGVGCQQHASAVFYHWSKGWMCRKRVLCPCQGSTLTVQSIIELYTDSETPTPDKDRQK